jgi:D-arabinose 1-dehydrogenase-like Zn-dependent alcohol dehydrogenase
MATMKALQITKAHESQIITIDRPEPGPNEVLTSRDMESWI